MEAKELTEAILKALKQEDSPVRYIIEAVIQKELHNEYIRGFETASQIALNTKN